MISSNTLGVIVDRVGLRSLLKSLDESLYSFATIETCQQCSLIYSDLTCISCECIATKACRNKCSHFYIGRVSHGFVDALFESIQISIVDMLVFRIRVEETNIFGSEC